MATSGELIFIWIPDRTTRRKKIPLIVFRRWASLFSSPTEGKIAHKLWLALSSRYSDTSDCIYIYNALGYVPFTGYPMERR